MIATAGDDEVYTKRYCQHCRKRTVHLVKPHVGGDKVSMGNQLYVCQVCNSQNATIQGFSADLM